MKIKHILLALILASSFAGCQLSEFEDNYADPSKLSSSSVERQFTGFLMANRGYVLPDYTNYFVNLRITLNRFNQATGWVNGENQYVPGSAAVDGRWNNYYGFLAQYREMEKIYNGLDAASKADNRIFMIAGATYLYDHTQKIVDLHGDIPWSRAGMLSTNGGDYTVSYPEYDNAADIYTKMLDDLAGFADELRTLQVNPGILASFRTQDLINRGNVDQWLKYINSLRIRMLTRVSGVPSFTSRARTEIAAILANPSNYPIVASNNDNVMMRIHVLGTLMGVNGFRSGLEDWNGNVAGKFIVDHMRDNADPRLTYLFEPGDNSEPGVFVGLDPLLNPSAQTELVGSGTLTIYNRSTLSRNQYFPGMLMNSTQVHLMIAEHYLKAGNDSQAKTHYETAIRESVGYYQYLRSITNDNTAPPTAVITAADVDNYIANPVVSWDQATSNTQKLRLIAKEKWLHFNVIQANENWAEFRRVDVLNLPFWVDDSNQQNVPPNRWLYPGSEQTFNPENYARVQPTDNLRAKLFWDVD